jgi:hypothetical protein
MTEALYRRVLEVEKRYLKKRNNIWMKY